MKYSLFISLYSSISLSLSPSLKEWSIIPSGRRPIGSTGDFKPPLVVGHSLRSSWLFLQTSFASLTQSQAISQSRAFSSLTGLWVRFSLLVFQHSFSISCCHGDQTISRWRICNVETLRNPYRVGLQAQANFSTPTFEPAHESRAGQRAALLVYFSCSCDAATRSPVRKRALPVASSPLSEQRRTRLLFAEQIEIFQVKYWLDTFKARNANLKFLDNRRK